jgi:hypothetical protein
VALSRAVITSYAVVSRSAAPATFSRWTVRTPAALSPALTEILRKLTHRIAASRIALRSGQRSPVRGAPAVGSSGFRLRGAIEVETRHAAREKCRERDEGLANAEIQFTGGELDGLKLIGLPFGPDATPVRRSRSQREPTERGIRSGGVDPPAQSAV